MSTISGIAERSGTAAIRPGQVLLLGFLGTVTMLFAGFTSAYLIRRTGSDWAPVPLPTAVWGNTVVLLLSTISLELACRRRSRALVFASLLLGLLFLAGQLLAWNQLTSSGTALGANAHGSFFYMLSAVHGLHLVGGIGAMAFVVARGTTWRLSANYWHFMGLVWVYVLLLLAT